MDECTDETTSTSRVPSPGRKRSGSTPCSGGTPGPESECCEICGCTIAWCCDERCLQERSKPPGASSGLAEVAADEADVKRGSGEDPGNGKSP